MPKHDLWICDRCGAETLGDDMDAPWQRVKVGTSDWVVCPSCAGSIHNKVKTEIEDIPL